MSLGRADCPIGTTEAAVRSCVSLMAAVTGQREELLAYWLDLYYQVRSAYEIEQHVEQDPRLICREDLYPVMRELMEDALKSTVRNKDAERAAGKKAAKDPSAPLRSAQDDRADGGPAEAEGDGADVSAPPRESALDGFEPVTVNRGWAAKKNAIRERLLRARAEGVTLADMEKTGKVQTGDVFAILEARPAKMERYRRVEAALDAIGK